MRLNRATFSRFYQYALLFFLLLCLVLTLGQNLEKQELSCSEKLDGFNLFINILPRNTLTFIYILSSLYVGKANIYLFICLNAAGVGVLLSRFRYASYILTVLPHGVLEMAVYLMLCAIVSDPRLKQGKKGVYRAVGFLYVALVLDACIEAWVTPMFVYRYLL